MKGVICTFLMFISLSLPIEAGIWDTAPDPLEMSHVLKRNPALRDSPLDDFYVLGWNAEGQFAYVLLENDAFGKKSGIFCLQDLVSDEVALTWTKELGETQTWESWWKDNLPQLKESLEAAKVKRMDFQLGFFPFFSDGFYYKVYTYGQYTKVGLLKTFSVGIEAVSAGKKIIYTYQGPRLWAAQVAGFIPSDQEKRVAVLMLVKPQGWKGPGGPIHWKVAGANLRIGFK